MLTTGYASLVPAFTLMFNLTGSRYPIGLLNDGLRLEKDFLSAGSTLVSTNTSSIQYSASMEWGLYSPEIVPSRDLVRFDFEGVAITTDLARLFLQISGYIKRSNQTASLLEGKGPKSTNFGDSYVTAKIETGTEKYKALESVIYVGAQRFILEDECTYMEFKMSEVA